MAKKDSLPRSVRPMLATLVAEPFDRPGWLFEIKWDGYRAIAEVEKGKVNLYSRNLISFTERYAAVARSLTRLGHDAVLDGEIVVVDAHSKPSFQLLQNYQKTGKGTLLYYVFDLLYLDGRDLQSAPLTERKTLLAPLLGDLANVRLSEHVVQDGKTFFDAVSRMGLEGVIAKKGSSLYRQGLRSSDWLKIKTRKRQEAVIGGFTEPRGSRQAFGALVLGVFEGDQLVYVGHAGGGFNDKTLVEIRARLEPLVQKTCPFKNKPKTNAPVHWVKPVLVCEVVFQEWTEDGSMRQPVFVGMREDKPATSVTREMPSALPSAIKADAVPVPATDQQEAPTPSPARSGTESPVKFSNPDKIYWPEDGYTKGDLIAYYRAVAPFMLPHLRDRPLSLHRHPNGIHGASFFQKDTSKQPPPAWVHTAPIPSESSGDTKRYIICQDTDTLLYVANLGCIEMHPWHSRLPHLDKPDYLIIDLDPQDVPFAQVVEAAQAVRRVLEKTCGECYCKTSGKRGLHVYLPLGARYDDDLVRQFAEVIARLVHGQLPQTTSVARMPAQRRNKVYVDFLQNRRGQTIAAAYSLRPVVGALVSTPLRWSEVTKKLDPRRFNIRSVPRRLDKVGDLWQPLLGRGVDLLKCLEAQRAASPGR